MHCLLNLLNSSRPKNSGLAQIWNKCNRWTGEVIDIHERSGKCIKSAETIIRKITILNKLIDWAWASPQKLKKLTRNWTHRCARLNSITCIISITCIYLNYLYFLYSLTHLNYLHHLYWMHHLYYLYYLYYIFYIYCVYHLYHLYYLIYWKSEKGELLSDNLKSRDASASKNTTQWCLTSIIRCAGILNE